MSYPQHERFKAEEAKLRAVEQFIEWFIENGPTSSALDCGVCGAGDRVPLSRMTERQKADLIMQCFDIDPKEFEAEKVRMLESIRETSE